MAGMSDEKPRIGKALRLVASGGWATEDEDVLIDLVNAAERLAQAVVADPGASPVVRSLATSLLEQMETDRPG
jgi:hypothetical protein